MRIKRWLAILVLTIAGCSGPAASSLAPATFEEFATNACDAFDALFQAVGNPDAGTDSELSKNLELAVAAGDKAQADSVAAMIIAELERGRQAASRAAGWEPGAATMAEMDRLLLAYQAMIVATRDSASGDASVPQQAFEAAGGVDAWTRMLQAAQAQGAARPPNLPPHECEGVPISW